MPPHIPRSLMTAQQRVGALLAEHARYGRIMIFAEASESGAVHVIGPDDDQPGNTDPADWLMFRRFRTVCGRLITKTVMQGRTGVFEDTRLCRLCHEAFGDGAGLLFEHNTEWYQDAADGTLTSLRASKSIFADRAEKYGEGRCPDCLHPVVAHPRPWEPPATACIGEKCHCEQRTNATGLQWAAYLSTPIEEAA